MSGERKLFPTKGQTLFPAANAGGFDIIDFFSFFFSTGEVSGVQVNGSGKRNWKFAAGWARQSGLSKSDAIRAERAAIKRDDRLMASEMKLYQQDKDGAMRHLRIANRDFLRRNDRGQADRIEKLLQLLGEKPGLK